MPPLFDIAVYPNAEWICVRAAVYGEFGYYAKDNDYMCSSILSYPLGSMGSTNPTPSTTLTMVSWISSFFVEIN